MVNIEKNILKLQEHQEEAYGEVMKLFAENRKAAVIFPTGCGKSFVLLKYILEHPDEKILFLSPRHAIKNQMYEYIVRYIGGDTRPIEEIQSEHENAKDESTAIKLEAKKYVPNIESILYQTISAYGEKDSATNLLDQLKPDLIVVDEMHHLKTKKIKENDSNNIVLDDENDEIVSEEERESQNKWGEKFHKFLEKNPQAKLLGLSATPIRTDGANVVERMFEDSVASEITLLEAIEDGIIYPPKYVVPDFVKEDDLETLLQKIERANGLEKEELKAKYDELVEKSANVRGIPELMQEHITKKDGKYIIYCKDINDMQEKMNKAKEWFGQIDDNVEIYGINSKEKTSVKQLEQFKDSNSEHLKLMYCVGMIDEGMHVDNISGIILTSKTESRINFLQRIGRAISTDIGKKQSIVIDLANNNEILYDGVVQRGYELNDLELLQGLIEWIEDNDGNRPEYEDGKTINERKLARRLARINNKYLKYVEDESLLEGLDNYKQKQIKDIIELGSTIGMFHGKVELNLSEEEKITDKVIDKFIEDVEIKGVRKELLDILSRSTEISPYLKNALDLENWCRENYGDKPIWERNLPKSTSNDKEEKRLATAMRSIRSKVIKKYEGKKLEEIENKQDRRIIEIINRLDEEYGLGDSLKNALEIENWCKVNFENKPIWEGRLPRPPLKEDKEDKEERKLGEKLRAIRTNVLKKYEGKKLEEIENKEDRRTVEIVRRLDKEYGLKISLKNALEVENWCKKKYEDKPIWERNLPNNRSEDKVEREIAIKFHRVKSIIVKKYEGKKTEEIEDEEDRRIVEIIRMLDKEYGQSVYLKNAIKIENWCKENYGDKPIWEKDLPKGISKNEKEKVLYTALSTIRTEIMGKYKGKELEEIENEEDRQIVEIIKRLDAEYGLRVSLKNALKIENWCKENFENEPIWERRLPRPPLKKDKDNIENREEKEERELGEKLRQIRGIVLNKYEGKELEEIENEEDRRIVEIVRKLDKEYGLSRYLKNALKIENWCKERFADKPISERKLPNKRSEDEEEKDLGLKLSSLRQGLEKKYEGKGLEEIENEEDRQIVEIIRRLDAEYNPKKVKQLELAQARAEFEKSKEENAKTKELEQQVEEQLEKKGKIEVK